MDYARHLLERAVRDLAGFTGAEHDPGILAKPYTIKQVSDLAPREEIREFICTENNRDLDHLVGR